MNVPTLRIPKYLQGLMKIPALCEEIIVRIYFESTTLYTLTRRSVRIINFFSVHVKNELATPVNNVAVKYVVSW